MRSFRNAMYRNHVPLVFKCFKLHTGQLGVINNTQCQLVTAACALIDQTRQKRYAPDTLLALYSDIKL